MRAVLLAVCLLCAALARAEDILDRTEDFDISAQSLNTAILEFARQARIEISADGDVLRRYRTPGVKGRESARTALTKLLSESGLMYRVVQSTVQIQPVESTRVKNPASVQSPMLWAGLNQSVPTMVSTREIADVGSAVPPVVNAQDERRRLEEVVVTAQKRAERLMDVPISMTVLDGRDLDQSTALSVGGMLDRVPGVLLDPGSAGGSVAGGGQLATRGVTAPSSYVQGPSPVGYYLDTVPFGLVRSSTVPDANVYDLARVEVLRGPQGTLYGANAQAGVVRVLTNDANLDAVEFKSRALFSQTQHGSDSSQVDAALNMPIIDGKLAMRAVIGYQNLSGWIDKTTRADINHTEQRNARIKVNARFTEALSLGLSAWMSRADSGGLPIATASDGRFSAIADVESTESDFEIYGMKVGSDFAGFSLMSVTSYIDFLTGSHYSEDLTRTRSFAHTVLTARTFAQEFNLTSTHEGPWRWTAGAIYRDGRDRQYQEVFFFAYPASIKYTSESWAVFGELTRLFFDQRVELTAGLRYFEDVVGQVQEQNASNAPPPSGLAPDAKNTFHSTTPRVILNWHPSEQSTLYISYAEGFRSGLQQNPVVRRVAPNVPLTEPDLLRNHELGAKGRLFDGRMTYDAALYYMDWEGVQLPLSLMIEGIGRSLLINGASASGFGADFSVNTRVTDGLDVGVNLSWNDLTVDADVFSNNILLFEHGDRLNGSAETTAGASLSYGFPLRRRGLEGRFSAAANWRSRISEKALAGTSIATTYGETMFITRAGFTVDSSRGWAATVYADNLNNEQGIAYRTPSLLPGVFSSFYPRPRTIGVQFEYRLD